ncbi:hypothetical protein M0R45_009777 [Rubus argutus]|uniref:Amine oxidase domain-containing protein n=1 Tax=Rubus argutus TaxID=59490 RepID=A0AAW1Y5F9_RUBAR
MSLASCWRFPLTLPVQTTPRFTPRYPSGRASAQLDVTDAGGGGPNDDKKIKKVVVVGSGWAGLGAAHHLCNQGFDVTVLESDNEFGGLDEVGIRGYWYPYRNIFSLVDELDIKPFTNWTKLAQYSAEGLEVEFPVFQVLPQLPTPLGTLYYSQFVQLPLVDRLTSLPVTAAAIDFDNTDTAWRKYDSITARELFKQFGCSERLYQKVLAPLLQVGLLAPAEQCSAAATLGLLSYILAHQKDFDLVLCRGTTREKIFKPVDGVYDNQRFADAVVLAVGISTLQKLIENSAVLCTREEFVKVSNLATIDVLSVKLWLDRFDDSFGWSFFDLNAIHDDNKDSTVTVLQADFYRANELLLLTDKQIVAKVTSYLSKCIKDFKNATVINKEIGRFPKSSTHFFPGSYKYMMRGSTSFPNLFVAGDWIITRHGSWSQEKSYVTGLEAANRTVDYFGEGGFAKIIPVEEDEPHIQALRSLNRSFNDIKAQFPLSSYFLQ